MVGLRGVVPHVIRRNYALKFGIALLVLGVSVGGVGIVGTTMIETDIEERTNDDYGTLAAQEAEKLETWDENNRLTVESLSRSSATASGDSAEIQSSISSRILELPVGAQDIHYVDVSNEEIVASTNDDAIGTSLSAVDEPWGASAASPTQSVVASAPYEGTLGEVPLPLIAYTKQVHDDPDHAIVYTVNLHSYAANFQSSERRGVTLVVDENDRVLADEYNAHILETYDDTGAIEQARSGGPTNPGTTDVSPSGLLTTGEYPLPTDESAVVGYAQVRNSDWVVLVHTPSSDAYGFVHQVRAYGLYATLVGVLLVGVIGAVLGRNTAVAIDRLTSRTEEMEGGNLDVDLETRRVDNIGRLYEGFDSMRTSLRETITDAETARTEAERARERTERVNRHLEAKADEYSTVMREVGEGDLTARMDAESDSEAMEEIATEFNEMIAELERTTAEVKTFAEHVATSSEEVTASSEEVRSASVQVTDSIQEIADGADRQNESLQSVTHEMNGLSTTTEQIAASSNQVADIAERTAETGQRGREAAQEAIEGMNRIEAESDEAVAEIERLDAEIERIDELLEFITDVAKETNMLALNANIEASRSAAGDEGFSVVAGEVKDLAEETKTAAEDIEDRLEKLQSQTRDTVGVVYETRDQVSENRDAIEAAVGALDEIADYAEETNVGVQEISAASEEQAASTQEVVAMVDDAATISEETTAESENVAAAAEEQTTALTEVSQSASDLTTQAGRLSEALDRFDTDAGTAPANRLGESPPGATVVFDGPQVDDRSSGSAASQAPPPQDDGDEVLGDRDKAQNDRPAGADRSKHDETFTFDNSLTDASSTENEEDDDER